MITHEVKAMPGEISAVFEFIAENPPMAMIVGGILLALLSVLTGPIDPNSTGFLRNLAVWLIAGGFVLQVLWLLLRRR
jgi:hypothetical protein